MSCASGISSVASAPAGYLAVMHQTCAVCAVVVDHPRNTALLPRGDARGAEGRCPHVRVPDAVRPVCSSSPNQATSGAVFSLRSQSQVNLRARVTR